MTMLIIRIAVCSIVLATVLISSCSSSDSNSLTPENEGVEPSATIIGQQNYKALLQRLLPIVDGTQLHAIADELVDIIDDIGEADSTLPITLSESTYNTETQMVTSNYTCDAGGTAVVKNVANFTEYEFFQCILNDSTYDGDLQTSFQRDQSEKLFTEFEVSSTNGELQIEGSIQRSDTASAFFRKGENFSLASARVPGNNPVKITDYVVSIVGTANDGQSEIERSFASDFSIAAPWIGGTDDSLQIQTTQGFVGAQPNDFYTSGILIVAASDGSMLTMNADNGDPSSVQVTVEAGGATLADTLNWDDMIRLACLDDSNSGNEPQYACGS